MTENANSGLFTAWGPDFGDEWVDQSFGSQSLIFYGELLPAIYHLAVASGLPSPLRILDVGPGSCVGTVMIDTALNHFLGVNARVDAVDHAPEFERYVRARYPSLDYRVGTALEPADGGRYDIVLASHVVEHTSDPLEFVAEMNAAAAKFCIFFAPYNEEHLIPAHHTRVDDDLMQRMPGLFWSHIKRSMGWRPSDDAETILFATLADANEAFTDLDALAHTLHAAYQTRPGPAK